MTSGIRLGLLLGAAGAVAAFGAWALKHLKGWRRKDPTELERRRRLELNRRGRITSGKIIDLIESKERESATCLVLYKYEVAGVRYESGQDLSSLAGIIPVKPSMIDQIVSIKYDVKKPTDSIIACEEWSGLPKDKPDIEARDAGLEAEASGAQAATDQE